MKQKLNFVVTTILSIFVLVVMSSTELKAQCIALTSGTTHNESFDTLANTPNGGTSSTLPAGWAFAEAGTNANTLYTVHNGGSSAGDTYSYGNPAGSTERSFGTQTSGTLTPARIGACFQNMTGATMNSVTIQFTGEQWRAGTATADKLTFEFSTDATSLTTGTYNPASVLDFLSIVNAAANAAAIDGHSSANQTTISATFSVTVANNATFWVRWTDVDVVGSDHGLAIDNFSIRANAAAATSATLSGRVRTVSGQSLKWVTVELSGGDLPEPVSVQTNNFGNYSFTGLTTGLNYIVSVSSKKYSFAQTTRTLSLTGDASGIDFIANDQ